MNDYLKDLTDELHSLKLELDFYNGKDLADDEIKAIHMQIAEHQSLIDAYTDLKLQHRQAKDNIMARRKAAHLRRNND